MPTSFPERRLGDETTTALHRSTAEEQPTNLPIEGANPAISPTRVDATMKESLDIMIDLQVLIGLDRSADPPILSQ